MKSMFVLPLVALLLVGCASGGGSSSSQVSEKAQASAKIHTELAGMYFERLQMGIALSEIDLALSANPNYAPAYNVRGLIHMSLREDKEAEEDFQHSLRLDKNDSEMHNNYGWFLCQRGKEEESISHFMAAVKNPLYTTPERAYLNAGLCYKKAGKNRDAEDFLQRALTLQPNLLQALYALAEVKFADGDYYNAKKQFQNFAQKSTTLTAEQLLLAIRIERRVGDVNAESSYAMQLRQRYPDSREAQMLMRGE